MARFINQSFEGVGFDNSESWSAPTTGTGCTFNVNYETTTPPGGGSQVAQLIKSSGAGITSFLDVGSVHSTNYVRVYTNFVTCTAPTNGGFNFAGAATSQGTDTLCVALSFYNSADSSMRYRLAWHSATWSYLYSTCTVTLNSWTRVEGKFDNSGAGSIELRVNGTSQGSTAANFGLARGLPRVWCIGGGGSYIETYTACIDLFAVDDADWVGEESTVDSHTATGSSVVKAPTTLARATIVRRTTAASTVKAPVTLAQARKVKRSTASSTVRAPTTLSQAIKSKSTTAASTVKAPVTLAQTRKVTRSTASSTVKAPTTIASVSILSSGASTVGVSIVKAPSAYAEIEKGSGSNVASVVKAPITLAICHIVRRTTASSLVKAPTCSASLRKTKPCTASSVVKAPTTLASCTFSSPGAANCTGSSRVLAPTTIASCRIIRRCVGSSLIKATTTLASCKMSRVCTGVSLVKAPTTLASVNATVPTQLDRIEQMLYVIFATKT